MKESKKKEGNMTQENSGTELLFCSNLKTEQYHVSKCEVFCKEV